MTVHTPGSTPGPLSGPTATGQPTPARVAHRSRDTKETSIEISLDVDGPAGSVSASTGLPFFDHMLDQIGRHGGFDLMIKAEGDLHVDGHHTVEDVGILLGEVFREALGTKAGVRRFASGLYPLDGRSSRSPSTVRSPVRSLDSVRLLLARAPSVNPDKWDHSAQLRTSAGMTLHVTKKAGRNTHHVVEACFKGVARCLRDAVRIEGVGVPSTKGSL